MTETGICSGGRYRRNRVASVAELCMCVKVVGIRRLNYSSDIYWHSGRYGNHLRLTAVCFPETPRSL